MFSYIYMLLFILKTEQNLNVKIEKYKFSRTQNEIFTRDRMRNLISSFGIVDWINGIRMNNCS